MRPLLVAGVLTLFLMGPLAHGGKVRILYSNDRIMQPVFLAMGRSTILRFDEKPKNVVIGNQNYFNVEFIGSDISIQPQGATTTNIFVYTENQTYGLILKVGNEALYDDLVTVRWKPGYMSVVENGTKRKPRLLSEVRFHRRLDLRGVLQLDLLKVVHSVAQGVSILEFEVKNVSQSIINTREIRLSVVAADKSAPFQKLAFKQDALDPGSKVEARMILRLDKMDQAELTLTYKKLSAKVIFPKAVIK